MDYAIITLHNFLPTRATNIIPIYLVSQGREVALHASLSTLSALYVSHLSLSYAFALIFSLVFEAPFINLQRILGY